MSVYMITYDLNSEGQNYDDVIDAIKDSSDSWCTYWKSSFLIKSSLSVQEVVDNISPHLDGNDSLIVIEAQNNYQGWLNKKQWNFIKDNIFS